MTSSVNSDSFFGLWCMFGRYIVFTVLLTIIITIAVLYKKKKCKKRHAVISVCVVALFIVLMFVGGSVHKPGFKAEGVDEFYNSILNNLTDENLYSIDTDTNSTMWRWCKEDECSYSIIYVQENSEVSQIALRKNDYTSRKDVYGCTDDVEYLFTSLFATKYPQYLNLKTDYKGDFYVEAGRYNIAVSYKMKNVGIWDYIGVVFPIFSNSAQYELSKLI